MSSVEIIPNSLSSPLIVNPWANLPVNQARSGWLLNLRKCPAVSLDLSTA